MLAFGELDQNSTKEPAIGLLEVSHLWNSERISATTGELMSLPFFQNFGSKIVKYLSIAKLSRASSNKK